MTVKTPAEATPGRGPAIFAECYTLALDLHRAVHEFPRGQRYALGQRLQDTAVGVLAAVVEANHLPAKGPALARASVEVEKLRVFARLAQDLGLLPFARYEALSRRIDTVGRMLGGWIKWAGGRREAPPRTAEADAPCGG